MILSEEKFKDFDGLLVVGDVHGNITEFVNASNYANQNNLFLIQLGDLVDYGHENFECIELMSKRILNRTGLMIIGNHDEKLSRYLKQKSEGNIRVTLGTGLKTTVNEFDSLSHKDQSSFVRLFSMLMDSSHFHYVVNNLIFAHASVHPQMWYTKDLLKRKYRQLAIYGQVDGFKENGFPNRKYDWVNNLDRTKDNLPKFAFFGHDILSNEGPTKIASIQSKGSEIESMAISLDTGSSKGGKLSGCVVKRDNDLNVWLPAEFLSFN